MIPDEEQTPTYYERLVSSEDDMTLGEVTKSCFYLGCVSFGGPIAHVGLFNKYLVQDKKIITENSFTQLFAICNVIPGPTSSQLLTAIAMVKTKSLLGGIISFLCFNMPAMIIMILLAYLMKNYPIDSNHDKKKLDFIKIITYGIWQSAVAMVFQAAYLLTKKIWSSKFQLTLMLIAFGFYFAFNNYVTMVIVMLACGYASYNEKETQFLISQSNENEFTFVKKIPFLGKNALYSFIGVYVIIYILRFIKGSQNINIYLMESFYRIGALIIGGGHVVIPMIISEFTKKFHFISEADVLNAFSIVSVLPGPMFNIAGYIGTFINGIPSGFISAFFLFLPGMLLLFTALGFISFINEHKELQFFLRGVSSSAIGFIFTSACILWIDSCFKNVYSNFIFGTLNVVISFILLEHYHKSPPLVMLIGAKYSLITSVIFSYV